MEAQIALLPLKTMLATLSLAQWIVLLVNGLSFASALQHAEAAKGVALAKS